jgi:DNA (cytosine-5)-methyltransferase 1
MKSSSVISPRLGVSGQWWLRKIEPFPCAVLNHHTRIPWRNKPAEDCPDGPRYKAIGNSMAVPVMRWVGERIDKVDASLKGIANNR